MYSPSVRIAAVAFVGCAVSATVWAAQLTTGVALEGWFLGPLLGVLAALVLVTRNNESTSGAEALKVSAITFAASFAALWLVGLVWVTYFWGWSSDW